MGSKEERCALCMNWQELQKSHLIPKAIHKRVRKGVAIDLGSPVRVDAEAGTSVLTDEQAVLNLLCSCCEQRFSCKGENVVIRGLRSYSKFRLRDDWLGSVSRLRASDSDLGVQLNRHAFYYFAISMAWRMSAADWSKWKVRTHKKLGPFEEVMRCWLLDEERPPDKVRVEVLIDTDIKSPALGWPDISIDSDMSNDASIYQFVVLGVFFRVHVGGKLTKRGAEYFNHNNSLPIAFHKVSFDKLGINQHVLGKIAATEYKGKLAKVR